MSDQADPKKRIFNEALALPPAQRAAFLDRACAGNAALRKSLGELLRAHDDAGSFLEAPGVNPALRKGAGTAVVHIEKIGDQIGRYKLLEQIGEGGCGVVYMAEQIEPVRRRVALKVIKVGMDTKSVIARFEAERQALALMDHPNIAKVLDAGATSTGRPYFVMELVRGVKITEFCDTTKASMQERLRLFIQVCGAIQHAHQKGVIHRDIKPSNILVTLNDGVPLPVVIDFGIAKATEQRLTDKTLFTAFEQFIGTPAYMSPEQAEMNFLGVDTRSDVYSLGVLLYELLTGQTPFSGEELLAAGLNEIRRVIREEEPVPPSTKLSTLLAGDLATLAKQRRTAPVELIHAVRGELDWIVMKALAKDRNGRYETASAFARDVERYLNDESVAACPPSTWYQFRKTVRKYRFAVTLGSSVLAALLIGLVVSSCLLVLEKKARREATQAEQKALLSAARNKQTVDFLERMLEGVGPSVALGRDTTLLREILDQTAADAGRELTNQPEVEADLLRTIGETYSALGDPQKAESFFRRVIEIERALPEPQQDGLINALNDLGYSLNVEDKLDQAAGSYREALRLAPGRSISTAESLSGLGSILLRQGKFSEAEQSVRQATQMRTQLKADKDLSAVNDLISLGDITATEHKPAEAQAAYRKALAICEAISQTNQPHYAVASANLGKLLIKDHKFAEAEPLLRRAAAIGKTLHVAGNTDLSCAYTGLVDLLMAQNRPGDLEKIFAELSPEDRATARILAAQSTFLARAGRWKECVAAENKLLELKPDDHAVFLCTGTALAASKDLDGYCEFCNRYLARLGGTKDQYIAHWLVRTCIVAPCPGMDMTTLDRLAGIQFEASKSTAYLPDNQLCKGAVLFRMNHYAECIQIVAPTLTMPPLDASDIYRHAAADSLLAMSYHQLKNEKEAAEYLAKAGEIMASLPKAGTNDLTGHWAFWVLADQLHQEATTLIQLARN